jgi:microcystin-dependent protein
MSEIRIMSFNFAPKGWAQCNGQFMQIGQSQALYSLLGTMYGGDGKSTFALPNLQGQVPIHVGKMFPAQGQPGGEAAHTLALSEMPSHSHAANATSATATASNPANSRLLSQSIQSALYANLSNPAVMDAQLIGVGGSSLPHENMQPYLTLNFCISLDGVFPSKN